ncbi:MAG: hypothetical protein FWH15_06375 [Betaproteobacteria bacterium]|nr:hypothetical protein [Betaproteobacteria bacterium]
MQEISYNFRMIGAELFDKAQRLGLQQRDYAAIKLLPESEKEAVRTVIENAEDREAVVDYVTEVMAKLFKERDELKEEIAAKKAVIANKDKTINELQEESIKRGAESNGSDTEPGEAETALNNLDESVRKAELAIIDAESCIALYARALGVKEDCEISCHPVFEQTANASLRRLFAYCRMAAERFNVPVGGGIDAVDDDESEGREIIRAALQRGNSDDGLADGNVYDHDNG